MTHLLHEINAENPIGKSPSISPTGSRVDGHAIECDERGGGDEEVSNRANKQFIRGCSWPFKFQDVDFMLA